MYVRMYSREYPLKNDLVRAVVSPNILIQKKLVQGMSHESISHITRMNESRVVIAPNIIIQQDLVRVSSYRVAMISGLLKNIGLFCRI